MAHAPEGCASLHRSIDWRYECGNVKEGASILMKEGASIFMKEGASIFMKEGASILMKEGASILT